jgi:kynureninase
MTLHTLPPVTRADCQALDADDPLAPQRAAFALPPGVVYLDGNSLGALPATTAARVAEVVRDEWGNGLIRSWNGAGWIDLPARVGGRIAALLGAQPDEVICADSTSLNLFKVLACALRLQSRRPQLSTRERRVILSERGNFPTDLYMAQGLADLLGGHYELHLVEFDEVAATLARLGERAAVLMLTHVNFATGAVHDMAALNTLAHARGALTVWDLAHSAGAVPLELDATRTDFAVGCGYKYLNGGPGAPAFVYVARRHLETLADDAFAQPLAGWIGHRAPFEFAPHYAPAAGIGRFAVGTPSILALAALECGVETVLAAGMDALRAKSEALTGLFIELALTRCTGAGLRLVTPREPSRRGSQVCLAHAQAWPVMQALIERGVIGDFRAPDILRFGFAPLYVSFTDVWDAVEALRAVLATAAWQDPKYAARAAVT